jgi:WD40 repeat protein
MVCTRDGRFAYIGCNDGIIHMWDLENGKEIARFKDHTKCIYDVALSSDEKLLASGGVDHVVRVWNASTGELLTRCEGHSDIVNEVVFAPNGSWLASAAYDGTVRLWKASDGTELRRFQHGDGDVTQVEAVAISPDGKWVVSGGGQKNTCVWNVEKSMLYGQYEIHKQITLQNRDTGETKTYCVEENGIRFNAAGDRVLSAGAKDKTIRIWDWKTGKVITRLPLDFDPWRFSISDDRRRLLISGQDGVIHLWAIPQFATEPR